MHPYKDISTHYSVTITIQQEKLRKGQNYRILKKNPFITTLYHLIYLAYFYADSKVNFDF